MQWWHLLHYQEICLANKECIYVYACERTNEFAKCKIFVNVTLNFIGIVRTNMSAKEWILKWSYIWKNRYHLTFIEINEGDQESGGYWSRCPYIAARIQDISSMSKFHIYLYWHLRPNQFRSHGPIFCFATMSVKDLAGCRLERYSCQQKLTIGCCISLEASFLNKELSFQSFLSLQQWEFTVI